VARLNAATHGATRVGAISSAGAVLPVVFAQLGWTPDSVLDVGCGEGHWLAAARRLTPGRGKPVTLGLDVDPDIAGGAKLWDAERKGAKLPLNEDERWRLTFCLEVAEHVSPLAGDRLVRELCRVSDYVLWSAAIPGQGGDGHVNEQPPAYWAKRFEREGWHLRDAFRLSLWNDNRIAPWYRQNLLLAGPGPHAEHPPLYVVHPLVWEARVFGARWP